MTASTALLTALSSKALTGDFALLYNGQRPTARCRTGRPRRPLIRPGQRLFPGTGPPTLMTGYAPTASIPTASSPCG